jgi:hypothetical protein
MKSKNLDDGQQRSRSLSASSRSQKEQLSSRPTNGSNLRQKTPYNNNQMKVTMEKSWTDPRPPKPTTAKPNNNNNKNNRKSMPSSFSMTKHNKYNVLPTSRLLSSSRTPPTPLLPPPIETGDSYDGSLIGMTIEIQTPCNNNADEEEPPQPERSSSSTDDYIIESPSTLLEEEGKRLDNEESKDISGDVLQMKDSFVDCTRRRKERRRDEAVQNTENDLQHTEVENDNKEDEHSVTLLVNSEEGEEEDAFDENNVGMELKSDRKESSTPAWEEALDWNDLLSPDFQEQKIPPKRRAGDSLLLLPTPSPMDEDFEEEEEEDLSIVVLSNLSRNKSSTTKEAEETKQVTAKTTIEFDHDNDNLTNSKFVNSARRRNERNRRRRSTSQFVLSGEKGKDESVLDDIDEMNDSQNKIPYDDVVDNVEPSSMRLNSPIRYNGKTILEVIPENPNNIEPEATNNGTLHKEVIEPLMIEKKKLQDRIFSHLKDYEKRVTPFRDVFEKVSF